MKPYDQLPPTGLALYQYPPRLREETCQRLIRWGEQQAVALGWLLQRAAQYGSNGFEPEIVAPALAALDLLKWRTQSNNARDAVEWIRTVEEVGARLKTHDETLCSGEHCCIHNPSDHHMRSWPLNWRDDIGVMERICPHGIGHPDPDDAAHNIRVGREYLTVHGCDGCCRPSDDALRSSPTADVERGKDSGI